MLTTISPSAPSTDANLENASREAVREQSFAAMRQKERFNWLAERLTDRLQAHPVAELEELLDADPHWPGQWEKACVMLALKATPEAIFVLEQVDTTDVSNSFRSLYDRCLVEARQRMFDR